MPNLKRNICCLAAAGLLVFSGSLAAAPVSKPSGKVQKTAAEEKNGSKKTAFRYPRRLLNMSDEEIAAEKARYRAVGERTQNVFTLLSGEIELQKGRPDRALGAYLNVLDRQVEAEVAERALELALGLKAYKVAEQIYEKWLAAEPEPGPVLRRISWMRALSLGEYERARADFAGVMKETDNEEQVKRLFLMLAQLSIEKPELLSVWQADVEREAARYPKMAEAQIADLLYSAAAGKERRAEGLLRKLQETDRELSRPTRLAVALLAQRQPQLLERLFQAASRDKMPEEWQLLEVPFLIGQDKDAQAYERLQQIIGRYDIRNAGAYMQAAVLVKRLNQNSTEALRYLEKAMQTGHAEQKSEAAKMAAVLLMDEERWDEALQWLDKAVAPEDAYDKLGLQATIAAQRKQWQTVLDKIDQAVALPQTGGEYVSPKDLLRLQLWAIGEHLPPAQAEKKLNSTVAGAAKDPNNEELLSMALFARGMFYADRLYQGDKAIADMEWHLKLNPDSVSGMNALGYTLLEYRPERLDEAFSLIEQAYRANPEEAQIADSMGWALLKKGDVAAALPILQKAYAAVSDEAEIALHLGEAYWLSGDQAQARELWHKVWQLDRSSRRVGDMLKKYGVRFQ